MSHYICTYVWWGGRPRPLHQCFGLELLKSFLMILSVHEGSLALSEVNSNSKYRILNKPTAAGCLKTITKGRRHEVSETGLGVRIHLAPANRHVSAGAKIPHVKRPDSPVAPE